jgi:hypothetical protein
MKKFWTFVLLLLIAGSFSFAFLRFQANSTNDQNAFNAHWRASFSRSAFFRTILNLHRDGDGRSMYLAPTPPALAVVLHALPGKALDSTTKDKLQQVIAGVVKKSGGVTVREGAGVAWSADAFTRDMIREVANQAAYQISAENTATLNIFLLNRFSDAPSNIGMTVREDGIVVFMDAISDLVGSNTVFSNSYIFSTVLHEFGHQVGLSHVESLNCIMQSTVESPILGFSSTPTQYCPQELRLIEAQRATYQ